jgi:phage shock protein E
MTTTFTSISQEDAKKMMEEIPDIVIIDVRYPQDYQAGHIPGALSIPFETISTTASSLLPSLDATLLVYCYAGTLSKEVARQLTALGYSKVYDMGGITTWPYEIIL